MTFDRRTLLKLLWFYIGIVVMGFGYALIIRPGLGVAPWDIFHIGVQAKTGIPLGYVIQGTGLAIILLNWTMAIRPTIGMVLNMLTFGPIMSWLLGGLPQPESLWARWLMLLVGIFIVGLGTALYVSADIGSGPRDGMMIGLTRKFNTSLAMVKNSMDLFAALVGWWLGGPLGLGTVVIALAMGPSMQFGMTLVSRLAGHAPFAGFVRPVVLKRN